MKARSFREHPTGRAPSRRRGVAVAAAFALLLAACGADDADGEAAGISVEDGTADDTDDTGGADDDDAATGDDASDDGDTAAGDDAAPDDGDAGQDADDAPAGGAPGEHRPPAASEPDCDAVTADPPGAIITFPSDDDPSWLDAGPGPVTVEVVGCSDSFEANIQYDAFHGQDTTPTLSGFTEGGTLGNWGEFSFEETYWTPGDWTVVIFVDDAATGDRVEYDEVTFTVQ